VDILCYIFEDKCDFDKMEHLLILSRQYKICQMKNTHTNGSNAKDL